MAIPSLTHLQFFVLDVLSDGEHSGHFIRRRFEEEDIKMAYSAFYQLMSRLELLALVKGRYEMDVIKGRKQRVRRYTLTSQGVKEWAIVRTFYRSYINHN